MYNNEDTNTAPTIIGIMSYRNLKCYDGNIIYAIGMLVMKCNIIRRI